MVAMITSRPIIKNPMRPFCVKGCFFIEPGRFLEQKEVLEPFFLRLSLKFYYDTSKLSKAINEYHQSFIGKFYDRKYSGTFLSVNWRQLRQKIRKMQVV